MKVIDLLNKIANGEELPKKIAIQNDVLIYNDSETLFLQDWYYMCDEENATWKIWAYALNDEVEIIEEDKKIEKSDFQTSQIPPWFRNEELIRVINENFELQTRAIRLLIDEVNKLKEGKDE